MIDEYGDSNPGANPEAILAAGDPLDFRVHDRDFSVRTSAIFASKEEYSVAVSAGSDYRFVDELRFVQAHTVLSRRDRVPLSRGKH